MSSIARTAATGGDLDPEFLRWQTSLPVDRRLLAEDLRGSQAHVRALVEAGLLTADEGDRLEAALVALPGKVARGELQLPLEEDVHMAVEALLRQEVGPLADKLHTGRSRNDQVATDLALWTRQAARDLEEELSQMVQEVEDWKGRFGAVAVPAYTHRQVAIPVQAWLWIDAALCQGLRRDRALLSAVRSELAACPLGAGAIGGTTLPIDPRVAAEALGFTRGPENPVDVVGQRDAALTLAFVCARISLHLARFSTDVIEMVSDGMARLGGAIACGSSMMPHKRNPDLFELVRGQAALRHGELTALLATFHGLGTGYHRDLQQDKEILFRAVDGTRGSLRMVTLALEHLELDEAACRRALEEGDAVATDLTECLVAAGTPFRDAYRKVGALVASCREQGRRLVHLTPDELAAAGFPPEAHERLDVAAVAARRSARFTPPPP